MSQRDLKGYQRGGSDAGGALGGSLARKGTLIFPQRSAAQELHAKEGIFTKISSSFNDPEYPTLPALKTLICGSWLNLLLLCLPVSFACIFLKETFECEDKEGHKSDTEACTKFTIFSMVAFFFSAFAICPLASIIGSATENISARTNQATGGFINATFGNVTELIISVMAILRPDPLCDLVQNSLLGSILGNMLLVLGTAMMVGGYKNHTQKFNSDGASMNGTILLVAVFGLSLPCVFASQFFASQDDFDPTTGISYGGGQRTLTLSRIIAFLLVAAYGGLLLFQFKTHSEFYDDVADEEEGEVKGTSCLPATTNDDGNAEVGRTVEAEGEEEDEDGPYMTVGLAICILFVSSVLVAVASEVLCDAVTVVTESIPAMFIGVIVIPIVGNAAEHSSAITAAAKNKMEEACAIAVGSSIQIAVFVLPVLVIVSLIGELAAGSDAGYYLTLNFHPFATAVVVLAVLIVRHAISDGETNWLEGMMLVLVYLMVASAFLCLPNAKDPSDPKYAGLGCGSAQDAWEQILAGNSTKQYSGHHCALVHPNSSKFPSFLPQLW